MSERDETFDAMGAHVRLIVADADGDAGSAENAIRGAQRFVERFEQTLSRFRPESELSRLNACAADEVAASPLLRAAVEAGLNAARISDGLVDPTMLEEIVAAGYERSLIGVPRASLREALDAAGPRRPAQPRPDQRWQGFEVDGDAGTVRRPPGLGFDSGGIGKGLAADMIAAGLRDHPRFLVDCGGDIRIGGSEAAVQPFEVFVEHPLSGDRAHAFRLSGGAIATSGIGRRIWVDADGGFAHHLLDPSTGKPAWTGLIAATALAPTTLHAETLSKTALLSGSEQARAVLAEHGGLIVHDSGRVELVGELRARPRLKASLGR